MYYYYCLLDYYIHPWGRSGCTQFPDLFHECKKGLDIIESVICIDQQQMAGMHAWSYIRPLQLNYYSVSRAEAIPN